MMSVIDFDVPASVAIGSGENDEVYVFPASFAQRRLWFLDQFEPNCPFYNIPTAVRLTGSLDAAVLQRAIDEIVRRHESLRTTFAAVDGQPVQVISPNLSLPLKIVDLRNMPGDQREEEALRLAKEEAQTPFDLKDGPLLRTSLLELGDGEHVFLLTMHHIVTDGWSMGVFVSEMAVLYESFTAGHPSPLPELPIQYADFSEWQSQWLRGEVLDAQIFYWKERLQGSQPFLDLPTDRPRPAVQTNRGASLSASLSKPLTEALKALGRQEGATLFMTLMSAFQTTLYHYSGQDDINVGTPIANRNRAEIEPLIGFFVNTLVIRGDLSGEPSFRQLLRRIRETTLGAYAHQDLPFEMLVEALQPERDMSHSPFFQVMLILQNAAALKHEMPNLSMSLIDAETGASTFDITMSVSEGQDGLSVSVEYNTDLFDASTIDRLLSHFGVVLENVVADPDQPISHLSLLTPFESEQMLDRWIDTSVAIPQITSVHQLFEAQAEQNPSKIAVVFGNEHVTYSELNQRANQLAHFLQRQGVGPDVPVGICVERSMDMVIAALAVMKAGGAYVPLDPSYPIDRLAHMLSDSKASLLLSQRKLGMEAWAFEGTVLYLDVDWPKIDEESRENVVCSASDHDLAYIIYTSGSTGRPKGVMVERHSLVNAFYAWDSAYQLGALSSHLQMASFSFDVFTGDLVRALCSGGRLVICPREWLLSSQRLYALICDENVDFGEFVPAVLRLLVQYLREHHLRLDSMRLLVCGSDVWHVDDLCQLRDVVNSQTRVINSFGVTEATVDSSYFELTTLDFHSGQSVPIGRPFANTQLYVLNDHLRPVAIGVPGRLYVGGAGLARGYVNQPALSKEKFIPNPFDPAKGARLYDTGDLVRYLPDGNIEFLGRADNQVKIRGFRIELGEVEVVLNEHPDVVDVAAVTWKDHVGNHHLVAYVVVSGDPPPSVGELRRFAQERLPDYMVPSVLVFLDTLPLSPNGKVDRRVLPEPIWTRECLDAEYQAPRTAEEELLVSLWSRLLHIDKVGIHDDFFDLGGHSLLATQLASRIRETFGLELPLRVLFESTTVAELAKRIEEARMEASAIAAPPILPVARLSEQLPLSFAQQRLWFLDQLEPNSPFYNIPDSFRLTGPLDIVALERSLDEVVRRHEVLRTTFATVDGRPHQVISPSFNLALPRIDLSDLPEDQREAAVRRLLTEDAQCPFDLSRGPLFRARLIRVADEDHVLSLVMHHIVSDEWSTSVIGREMTLLYDAFAHGRPSPLPELAIQYADFASWQRQWLQGDVLESQLSYWRQQLTGIPALLDLPTDRPRPPVQTYPGHCMFFEVSEVVSQGIKDLCQHEGVTLFMALLGAFQTLLFRYSGQDDICVGTPIANRNRSEIESLVGFFVNTLVMRTDMSGDPPFRHLLRRVRESALGAYTHQDLPFEMLVDAVQPNRDLSHSPLFQVMFVLQNPPDREPSLPHGSEPMSTLAVDPLDEHSGTAKFDLTLFIGEDGGRLVGALEYNTDLFDALTIERMAGHFQVLLQAIITNPDQPIGELPILTEAERRQLLVEWNDTDAECPTDMCVHQLFESQVERSPEAIAVEFGQRRLSYRELNARANQLAHYLRNLGVGPENLVGVCVERSLEMVVALLGILKAGAAYLPLDPRYPQERLSFMVTDANVRNLLTQRDFATSLPTDGIHVVCLDDDWSRISQESESNVRGAVTADNMAYVIYTSGSTGKPKGAMIHHGGLVNYLDWVQRAYPIAAGKGAPVHSSISFDLTITGLFGPLLVGRCVHLVPEDAGVEALGEMIRQHSDFSLVKITPAHLELLGQQLVPEQASGRTRAFIIGGENMFVEHIAFWQRYAPETELVNEYGPTETVVGCCVYWVPPNVNRAGPIPIGRTITNTQLYILDRHLQPVPIGVSGELFIAGAGVAKGYLNRPQLSAERFIPDPFSRRPGARMYRTGDLVRYFPDGNIECLGRVDDQVKIRGFRVELGEVEAALGQHPGVREVAVIAREDTPGDRRLVAYLVPDVEQAPTTLELKEFLGAAVPEYMIPSVFVILESLPLNPNGKVDRKSLPAPDGLRPDLEDEYVAPRNRIELLLASIWAQVLGLEKVGVHSNFFTLGGDSILSIQVIARARQAGIYVTPRQLFQAPTVAGLAALATETSHPIEAEQGVVEGAVSLTPIQRWFLEETTLNHDHWNQSLLLEVRQHLDVELLRESLRHLMSHHDALRLRYRREGENWQQTNIGLDDDVPFSHYDLTHLSPSEQSSRLESIVNDLQSSLDISQGPIVRMAYFDLGFAQSARLFLVVHHLAVDGVSWRILLEDLLSIYQQLSQAQSVMLPMKTTSFLQWSHVLNQYAQSEALLSELDYWTEVTQPALHTIPIDGNGDISANVESSSQSISVSLSVEETQSLLQEVAATYHSEINDALLSALATALRNWLGNGAMLIELEGHGREDISEQVDLSRTVGWFTSSYPIRLPLDGFSDPGQALRAMREHLQSIPGRGIGYGLLRYLNQDETIRRRIETLPQPQVSVNYLGQMDQAVDGQGMVGLAKETRGAERDLAGKRTSLLDITGGVIGGQLSVEWTFSESLHRRSTIEWVAADFIEALRALIAYCRSEGEPMINSSDVAEFGWDEQDVADILREIDRVSSNTDGDIPT